MLHDDQLEKRYGSWLSRNGWFIALSLLMSWILHPAQLWAAPGDLYGPPGSGQFGQSITILPNGNFVVIDSSYDQAGMTNVGAAYLYHGATHQLISMLTGSSANDQIGAGGVTVLTNGNYIIRSPYWDAPAAANAGAVTWASSATGVSGVVSSDNSLVGSHSDDGVPLNVIALTNGNYVVNSQRWNTWTGAVTWGDGTTGISGIVTSANSLLGSTTNAFIASAIVALTNGNYVINSAYSDVQGITQAGAVTWADGTTGITGTISSANSLVGSSAYDMVGLGGVTALPNGNYLVGSINWDMQGITDVGAVTWADGTTGITGTISSANSLVGSSTNDTVGMKGITVLTNGNYLVRSPNWDAAGASNAGAVTWGDGAAGITGTVSSDNSLIGSSTDDFIGNLDMTALTNGNYVVHSPYWDAPGIIDAGAATWGNGTRGISGVITSANSLIGSNANDRLSYWPVVALTNGNYIVRSPFWDAPGIVDAGAVSWGNGSTGITGFISLANSLIGSHASDQIGSHGVTALSNGNYVVSSPYWDSSAVANVGAATWGNGSTGSSGLVSDTNSLVGSTLNDVVGVEITALSNGNYVVASYLWDSPEAMNVGAVTWGNGSTGTIGIVSSANSLIGSTVNDEIGYKNTDVLGSRSIVALTNGNYVVSSPYWSAPGATFAGAATWGNGSTGTIGVVSNMNSLVGDKAYTYVSGGVANEFGSSITWTGITPLSNGNYVVSSPQWSSEQLSWRGAVTWGNGVTGSAGSLLNAANILGEQSQSGSGFTQPQENTVYGQVIVGIPNEQRIAFLIVPQFSSGLPSNGQLGQPYQHQFSATGSPVPSFSLAQGSSLPAGLSLSANGLLSGTPSVSGSFSFTVVAHNGIQPDATQTVTLQINQAPQFSSSTPPAGQIGQPYHHQFTATGSPTPSFSLVQGSSLPAGLSLSANGLLSGTPSATGSFSFTVVAHNGIQPDATQTVTLQINQAPQFSSGTPPAGQIGQPYQHQFSATGSPTPSFSLAQGSNLPAGLSLSADGLLSGTPSVSGSFSFTVVAHNGIQPDATQAVLLEITQANTKPEWHIMLPLILR